MKSTPEPQDSAPVLGQVIRPTKPAPAPVPVAPGVVRNASGQLETRIPAPAPVWIFTDEQTED